MSPGALPPADPNTPRHRRVYRKPDIDLVNVILAVIGALSAVVDIKPPIDLRTWPDIGMTLLMVAILTTIGYRIHVKRHNRDLTRRFAVASGTAALVAVVALAVILVRHTGHPARTTASSAVPASRPTPAHSPTPLSSGPGSPTATDGTAAATPPTRHEGAQSITNGLGVDLDSRAELWGGGSPSASNVNFGIVDQLLRPLRGATMTKATNADFARCRTAAKSAEGVPEGSLSTDDQYCVQTPAGRIALVKITHIDNTQYGGRYELGIKV
jgi:hypothetical protein